MISEAEILDELESGIEFSPLSIRVKSSYPRSSELEIDAIIEVESEDQRYEFAAELRARSTPRAFEDALNRLRQTVGENYYPMLIVPYLRERQLEQLAEEQLSGIDLSGNGIVCIPGKLLVFRTGKPNKYPDSAPTKYAYRGTTSLVARTFLCRPSFGSLADIGEEIETRGGSIAVSTISKALKRMESDLIVVREYDEIRLRQPEKLLEQIRESYREPKVTRTFTCSMNCPLEKLILAAGKKNKLVLSGRSSVDAYAVMGRDEWPILYTPRIDRLLAKWGTNVEETARFVELELRQTDDPTVYFDARMQQDLPYASPMQTFLELSAGEKREREVAAQVRDFILRNLKT
jgi:hypothetical protein